MAAYSLLTFLFFSTALGQRPVVHPCDKQMFQTNVNICLSVFNSSMETIAYQDACPWPAVKPIYTDLHVCVDKAKVLCKVRYPELSEQVYVEVHRRYFSSCGYVRDPSPTTLIMLIAPGIVTTLLLPLLCKRISDWEVEKISAVGR